MKPQYKKTQWSILRLRPIVKGEKVQYVEVIDGKLFIVEEIGIGNKPMTFEHTCIGVWECDNYTEATEQDWNEAAKKLLDNLTNIL